MRSSSSAGRFIALFLCGSLVLYAAQVARVEGLSMAPTLNDQDRLIVDTLVYRFRSPRRGDIVMLYYPSNPNRSFVKRVIAEVGDRVRIQDGRVYVNDVQLADNFELAGDLNFEPTVVPDGCCFVMSDRPSTSAGDRHWGLAPRKYILGRVAFRWWPLDSARAF